LYESKTSGRNKTTLYTGRLKNYQKPDDDTADVSSSQKETKPTQSQQSEQS